MHVLYEIMHTVNQDDDSWEDSISWKQEVKLIAASDNLALLVEMKNKNVEKQNTIYKARQEYRNHMESLSPVFSIYVKDSDVLTWFDKRQKLLDSFQKKCVEIVNMLSEAFLLSKEEIISYTRKDFEIQSVEIV